MTDVTPPDDDMLLDVLLEWVPDACRRTQIPVDNCKPPHKLDPN